jgi:hypothetical protein
MEFKIYIPNNYNKSFLGIKIKTNKTPIINKLLKQFSGFTIFKNQKGYYIENNKTFIDKIDIIQIFSNKKNEKAIKSICKDIKNLYKQQSVLYTKDNKSVFV